MNKGVYEVEAGVEATHWWFVGRRQLVARQLHKIAGERTAAILDVGSGTGANLRLLRELGYTNVTAADFSEDAIAFCAEKGLGRVTKADVRDLPFEDHCFDVVLATDIVEHVVEDGRAVSEIARVLRPGGTAILTVPAFTCLWGLQDEVSHHKRRYRLPQFQRLLEEAGFTVGRAFYFNYLLFLPILLARRAIRALGIKLQSENQLNTGWLNRILTALFAVDVRTAPWLRPPLGVSIMAIARKPEPARVSRKRERRLPAEVGAT